MKVEIDVIKIIKEESYTLSWENAEELILSIENAQHDYDFTLTIARKFVKIIKEACADVGETFDMRNLE